MPYTHAPIHHTGLWRIFLSPQAPGDWTQRTLLVIYRIMWCLQVFQCSIKDDKFCHRLTFYRLDALSGSTNRRVTPLCRAAFIDFSPVAPRVYKSSAPRPAFSNWLPVILWGLWRRRCVCTCAYKHTAPGGDTGGTHGIAATSSSTLAYYAAGVRRHLPSPVLEGSVLWLCSVWMKRRRSARRPCAR